MTFLHRAFPPLKHFNIPCFLTSVAVVSGTSSIYLLFLGMLKPALTTFFLCIILDFFDGMVARRLKQTSEFGMQMDSLADCLNFCVLPSLMAYKMGLNSIAEIVLLITYTLAGIWRLAHFNITGLSNIESQESFTGIPTTLAASWILVLSGILLHVEIQIMEICLVLLFMFLTPLMISGVSYPKHGMITKSLYVLLPLSILLVWLAK